MKKIPLTPDKFAFVDDADYEWLVWWKWTAQIKVDGKHIHLGYFQSEKEAAKAYDKAALKYFGEFANPNFKESE